MARRSPSRRRHPVTARRCSDRRDVFLAHQAGLFAFDERVDADVVADLDRLAGVMERQRPIWPPGERQAYHAITLGFYENELVRRIDPDHRTIGRVLNEDIAAPLGVGDEVFIGTPPSVPDERLAALVPPGWWARLTSMPLAADPRCHVAPLGAAPVADRQSGHRLLHRCRARHRSRARGSIRRRGGDGPGHRHRLWGVRRCRGPARSANWRRWQPSRQRRRRHAGATTTNASAVRSSSRWAS